jgi:twin BRCT domain
LAGSKFQGTVDGWGEDVCPRCIPYTFYSVFLFGSYTRELNLSVNTHLIAREAKGPKYDAAKNAPDLAVVRLRWLEDCLELRLRVDERRYSFETNESNAFDASRLAVVSLRESLEHALRSEFCSPSTLFSAASFYLVGFSEKDRSLRNQLGILLHRGLGTIYWDYHNGISHVIVNDGADNSIR